MSILHLARVKRIAAGLLGLLVTPFVFLTAASAEGSGDLIENGGWRPFIESRADGIYYETGTAGVNVPRQQVIKAYAKAGETVYFGSSTYAAEVIDPTKDISVKYPGETTLRYYDVQKNNATPGTQDNPGYIEQAQEPFGPHDIDSRGYHAYSFVAPTEGIYEFRFYGYRTIGKDPAATTTSLTTGTMPWHATNYRNARDNVAAWDVTVARAENGVMKAIDGRVYADYLTLALGEVYNKGAFLATARPYVLTTDGYIYGVDFNGMLPSSFLFFGNNRGVIDNVTGRTLYHSSVYENNALQGLKGNTSFHSPAAPDTAIDTTYKIFFNQPDKDFLAYLDLASPKSPGYDDLTFNGGAPTPVGVGGTFSFTSNLGASYVLELQFNNDPNNVIRVADACMQGVNTYQWDGLDANGVVAQPGTYTATLRLRGGEYHFPMIDVENAKWGIEVERTNGPAVAGASDPYTVYYDNTSITLNGDDLDFSGAGFAGNLAQLNGISSKIDGISINGTDNDNQSRPHTSGDAMRFESLWGDQKLLDIWTNFSADAFVYTEPFVVYDPAAITPTPIPTATPVVDVPKTGDSAKPLLWAGMLLGAGALFGVMQCLRRRYE